jgi:hypothetical protein
MRNSLRGIDSKIDNTNEKYYDTNNTGANPNH